jgi:hypothetical protein
METVESRFKNPSDLNCIQFIKKAFVVEDASGNVVAFVRDEKIAKTVQWAIAAQAESSG